MAEQSDIYPLGQGQGLLSDIVNFALSNLHQFGRKTAETNRGRSALFEQLKKGSSPSSSLMQDLMREAANVNPVGGVIAPTGNKILQGLFEALRTRAPKLVQQAENIGETVYPYLVPRELMPVDNTVGVFRRAQTLPKGELYLRGGRPQPEQIDTLAHELRHFITSFDPATAAKRPEHMLETAQQLTTMMPPVQRAAMEQNYLPSKANAPLILEALRRIKGTAKPAPPQLAYDESLSYLTESLLNPQGADPALEAIATALGQGLK